MSDLISRQAAEERLKKVVDEMALIFADIREKNVDDSVCGLCEYDCDHGIDGCANECPGFERDDCFKLKEEYQKEWTDLSDIPSVEPEKPQCSWYGEDGKCHFAEQEMDECDDCISRKAAVEAVRDHDWMQAVFAIAHMPSVEPEIEKCEDCISRIDMLKKLNSLCNNTCEYSKIQRKSMCDACNLDLVFDMINNAKSVEPERKKGKWIEMAEDYYKAINEYGGGVNEITDYFTDDIACPKCLSKFSTIDNETERFDFCPACGADMREVEDG